MYPAKGTKAHLVFTTIQQFSAALTNPELVIQRAIRLEYGRPILGKRYL